MTSKAQLSSRGAAFALQTREEHKGKASPQKLSDPSSLPNFDRARYDFVRKKIPRSNSLPSLNFPHPFTFACKDDLTTSSHYAVLKLLKQNTHTSTTVSKVINTRTGQLFAAKVFLPSQRQNFRCEVTNLLKTTTAPHALRFYETTTINSKHAIITELIPGGDTYRKKFSSDQLVTLFRQLLEYLAWLHARGLIHGDIKPENLFFANFLKVIDLGFTQDKGLGPLGHSVQTHLFRAPEVLLGNGIYDESIDLWGVACVIFELYTGRPLFDTSNIGSLQRDIVYIHRIAEQIGLPTRAYLAPLVRSKYFFNLRENLPYCVPLRDTFKLKKVSYWKDVMLRAGKEKLDSKRRIGAFIALIEKMLRYQNRISAKEALADPLFLKR